MKKAISILSFCIVAALYMVGCSNSPLSTNETVFAVDSVYPAPGSLVSLSQKDTAITVWFNKEISFFSSFGIKENGRGIKIYSTSTGVNNRVFSVNLKPGKIYTCYLYEARDKNDNKLPGDYIWEFTTDQNDTNQPMLIDSVFPAEWATNVPTDIENIVAYFNKNMADLSEMPGAQFGIASEDGSHQIGGTYGLSANIFSRQLTNVSERVYLKPNTKYIAHVSAVKDEYGNEMVGEKSWSFTTGAN